MKKIIAFLSPLFFSFSSYSQQNTLPSQTIELSDSDHIVIMIQKDSASVGGFIKPNGRSGSVWFTISGDTTKWGKKDFGWKDASMNINCWIPNIACGKSYILILIAKAKNQPEKKTVKHFKTKECLKEKKNDAKGTEEKKKKWHVYWGPS